MGSREDNRDFRKHTDELVELYSKRPYQGQSPDKASIIFLSSDANYSAKISEDIFFNKILEYHMDSIAFWKKYQIHHPFLLPDYPFRKTEDGVPYHKRFSKLGLGSEHAEHISFLELLDVPTIGSKSKDKKAFYNLLSLKHLQYIESLILGGGKKLFFLCGVKKDIIKLKKNYSVFNCLDFDNSNSGQKFEKLINGNKIKETYHFSSSHIFSQIPVIRTEIDKWLTDLHTDTLPASCL